MNQNNRTLNGNACEYFLWKRDEYNNKRGSLSMRSYLLNTTLLINY